MSLEYQPSNRPRRTILWIVVLLAIVTGALPAWYGIRNYGRAGATAITGNTYYTVIPTTLEIRIKKDGELQAVTNKDIVCDVEGQSTIRTIVPEGTYVKKGDPLFELDSSEIRRKIQPATIDVRKGESDLTAAKEQLHIQESKNTADLEAAMVELKLAQLDLQEYTQGKYPQQLSEFTRNVEMARTNLKSKDQALAQTRALFQKGFVTQSEVEKAQLEQLTQQNEFEKKTTELAVLKDYTHEKDSADKQNKLAQAEKKVARVQSENASNLSQKVADAQTKEQSLLVYRAMLEHLEQQLAACTVVAPTAGIVVYGSSAQSMFYRESPIQAGAKVMEQQLVVRLPDTTVMKVVAKIPEFQAVKLKVDKDRPLRATVHIVGRDEPLGATVTGMSVLSDNMQRWWNPDMKEYPVDLTLDQTAQGMKPGTSATVEILVERLEDVLAVPVAAIYSEGGKSYVAIDRDGRLDPVEVKLGGSNETHVQVKEGLTSGQRVAMLQVGQGRELLKLAGIEPAPPVESVGPTSQPVANKSASVAQVPVSR
jgi:HlyD family secretion protein